MPSPTRGEGAAICAELAARRGTVESRNSANLRRRAQILREERKCAAPGEIGRGLVVARAAGVVVEGVLRARIDVLSVLLVVGLERSLEVGDAFVDVVVVLGVLQKQRRFDRRDLVGGRLRAIVGDAGSKVRTVGGHAVHDAAAEAEADRADLAGRFRVTLEEADRRYRLD